MKIVAEEEVIMAMIVAEEEKTKTKIKLVVMYVFLPAFSSL